MTDSLSPVALSRLTWTAEDRRAWDETYARALWISAARDERRAVVDSHPAYRALSPVARRIIADNGSFSVHVDVLAGREG